MYDLLLRGGRVIDPAMGIDATMDVAISKGRIAAVKEAIPVGEARETIDVSDRIVTPGLVDIHTHFYWGVCEYGIDPDPHFLPKGTTTALDVGSAGAYTFPALRRYIMEPAKTRLYALLHVNALGMVHSVGELQATNWINPELAAAVAKENADVVKGIKVRLSRNVAGESDWIAFQAARKAADLAAMPLMVHFGDSITPLNEVLDQLNNGDTLTHCFTGRPNNILDEQGKLIPAAVAARNRGVIFDVGHGMGSFGYAVAKAALAQGLPPTTISTDYHMFSANYPVVDFPTTMSKFMHLGMSLPEVVARSTMAPARALGLGDGIGTLRVGAEADVCVMQLVQGEFPLDDCYRNTEVVRERLVTTMSLRAGKLF